MKRGIYMTVAEIADLLEVSKMTVYRLVHDGTLPAINAGKRSYRVRRADVAAYIKKQTVSPREAGQ